MNNKRRILLVLCICICALSMCACGKKKVEKEEPLPTLSPFATEEEKDAYYKKLTAHIKVEKANGKYDYDQEDNIINDKYRNYYHVMVSSFCDSNNDGMGDLNGITSKLDYIQDMGYNGIWLTPIMTAGQYHKYDIIDFMSVDPQFGTLDDFKKLADECKKRNISLILDLVLNHTSTQHPWFIKAKANPGNKSNKYASYYNFSKEKLGETYYDLGNGYYYEAEFWDQMPDLNLHNPAVRKEIEKIISFWMKYGIGGFRLDAVIHYDEDNTEENVKILKWLNDYIKGIDPNAYIVGEAWASSGIVSQYYASGVDSFFNFEVGGSEGKVTALARAGIGTKIAGGFVDELISNETSVKANNSNAIDAPFLSNHDMPRSYSYFGGEENRMKLAIGLYQMMSGSTFTYYGEEIGMQGNGDADVNYRLGMYWTKNDNGEQPDAPMGATQTNADLTFGSVEEQLKNNNSILNYTKRILQLKAENPEIARGNVTKIDGVTDGEVAAFKKTYNNSSVIIIVNSSKYPKEIKVPKSNGYKDIRGYATVDDTKVTLKGDTLTMSGNAIVVLK